MKGDIWHDPLFLAGLKGGGQGGSASGPIVTFTGDGSPLRSLRIGIDPVQDLHGFDNPWPSGGGKNKFDVDKMVNTSDITISNGVITVTGNSKNSTKKLSELADLTIGEAYILTANTTGSENLIYLYGTGANVSWSFGTSKTITQEMLDALVFFYGGSGTTSQISNFMIRLSSVSDASFSPYSNLCPISGWDEANLWRTGKNLSSVSGWSGHNGVAGVLDTPIPPNTEFTMSGIFSRDGEATNGCAILFGFSDGTDSGWTSLGVNLGRKSATKTYTKEIVSVKFYSSNVGWADSQNYTLTVEKFQLELGSTATTYAPYTGASYPITIPTPPGTVYGGYISVSEDGSAELVVDRAMVDLGTLTWTQGQFAGITGYYTPAPSDIKPCANSAAVSAILSNFSTIRFNAISQNYGAIALRDTGVLYVNYADSPTGEMVYYLATPLHYPLSDITVQTLAGTNVMWADCGDIAVEWAGGKGFGKEAMLAWVMNR